MPRIQNKHIVIVATLLVSLVVGLALLRQRSDSDPAEQPQQRSDDRETGGGIEVGFDDPSLVFRTNVDVDFEEQFDEHDFVLRGRVTNPSGKPIESVRISLTGSIRATSHTEDDGIIIMPGIPSGKYTIEVTHPQYQRSERDITIRADKSIDLTMHWLLVTGHVRGDGIDIPIEKFQVVWSNMADEKYESDLQETFQQTKGKFSLTYEDRAYDAIRVSAFGYENRFVPIDRFTRSEDGLEGSIALTPVAGIEGKVVDEKGDPISGASIYLQKIQDYSNYQSNSVKTYSASDGRFRVTQPDSGMQYIVANHKQYGPSSITYRESDRKADYVITLRKASVITGHVTYAGAPLAGQDVKILFTEHEWLRRISARTDANGRYAAGGLPGGEYIISFDISAKDEMQLPLTKGNFATTRSIAQGERITVDFEIPAVFGSLDGQIRYNGESFDESGVLLESTNLDKRIRLDASVDEFGYYSVDNVPAGNWTVLIVSENGNSIQIVRESASVYADETTLLDIDIFKGAGSISGIKYIGRESIISLYKGHQPVDGRKLFQDLSALVTLGNIPADMISVSLIIFSSQPNLAYEFTNLPDGKYTLAATMLIDEPFLLNAPAAPLIVHEITIVNGEAIVVDFNF